MNPLDSMTAAADPLAQLRDLQAPEAISNLPAFGWWVLALLTLTLILSLSAWSWRRWRQRAYRRQALKALQTAYEQLQQHNAAPTIESQRQFVQQCNQILKRAAISGLGRSHCAALDGRAWLQFLDQSQGNNGQFSSLFSSHWQPLRYASVDQLEPLSPQILDALYQQGRRWIKRHRLGDIT